MLKLSKTTYPQKLFAYDCITLYECMLYSKDWKIGQTTNVPRASCVTIAFISKRKKKEMKTKEKFKLSLKASI